jgi:hypothetical protein
MSDPNDVPQAQCPRCKQWQDDYDGFGVLVCPCGYCAHAATDDGVCVFCGERECVVVEKAEARSDE